MPAGRAGGLESRPGLLLLVAGLAAGAMLMHAAAAEDEICDTSIEAGLDEMPLLSWLLPFWPTAPTVVLPAAVPAVGEGVAGGPEAPTAAPLSLWSTLALLIMPAVLSSMLKGADTQAHQAAVRLSKSARGLVYGEVRPWLSHPMQCCRQRCALRPPCCL